MKRAQVTIFVIIGLALLLFVGFILFDLSNMKEMLRSSQRERIVNYDFNEGIVRNTVSSCIDSTSFFSIRQAGNYSGYLNATAMPEYDEAGPAVVLAFGQEQIPVMLDASGVHDINDSEIAARICRKVYVDLSQCLNASFSTDASLVMSTPVFDGNFSTIADACKAIIRNGSVFMRLDYPVSLSSGKFFINTSGFASQQDVNFLEIHKAALDFVNLVEAASVNNIFNLSGNCPANYLLVMDGPNVFRLIDNSAKKFSPYSFRFAVNNYTFVDVC
jgi:hypothetical protein